jgi:hypothetical protein
MEAGEGLMGSQARGKHRAKQKVTETTAAYAIPPEHGALSRKDY